MLELGGEIWFGKIGTGKEIKTKLYFGFNPRDPRGNYLYAKVNKLTIRALLDAFEKNINLPEKVKDSGFPEGLVIGFTQNPDGKTLILYSIFYTCAHYIIRMKKFTSLTCIACKSILRIFTVSAVTN